MPGGYQRPSTPAAVERQLRQEAGFGCARCGHPYIEYHHIVPYEEEQHFRAEDMVALCGNCHPAVAKLGRNKQYGFKNDPFNPCRGIFRGALEYDKDNLVFTIGGNWYEDVPVIIQLRDTPIISCSISDGQVQISLDLCDKHGTRLLRIFKNDIVFRVNDLWDFEYGHNLAIARYGPGDIALKLDFRGPDAIIEGKIWVGGMQIRLAPNETILPGQNRFIGGRFSACKVGIQFGEPLIQQA